MAAHKRRSGRLALGSDGPPFTGPGPRSPLRPVAGGRGGFEERGQTVTIEHSTGQRWWYLGGHKTNEVTLLNIWDSWGDRGVADGE